MGDERRWRLPATPTDRHQALEELTTSVRQLVAATVATGHQPAELRALAVEVDRLADRLAEVTDDDPWKERSWGPGVVDPGALMGINPAIGRANPLSPVVDVRVGEDASVAGTVRFDLQHVGPPYRAHGGIIASVFDQVLGIASIASGSPGMTGSMTVKYRRATPLHEDLRIEARFVGGEGRTSHATGEIYDDEGRVTAEAEAMFVRPRGET
ncbi:MAG: thioesterase superfamily protein [Actinomycetia bacterium]|nr:thioesterase superfamily protein [Actinomycetes bacterium]